MTTETNWPEYYERLAGVATEMIGAADYLDSHPEVATDARVAETFRTYAARMRRATGYPCMSNGCAGLPGRLDPDYCDPCITELEAGR